MQDRYTADIGDLVKYGLLRSLAGPRRLGIAWYLFPDEIHNSDGKHTSYLQKPELWRHRDPALFDKLNEIVQQGRRRVREIELSGALSDASFSGERLEHPSLSFRQRAKWREEWFERVLGDLKDCDLVFADPDNGLCENEKYSWGSRQSWKRIPLSEARRLAMGRTAIIYHHNTRRRGGHQLEIRYWAEQLGAPLALRWRAYSARTFFVVNPTPEMPDRLAGFAAHWGPKAECLHL